MRARNALTILLAVVMILSPISMARADLNDANLLGYWNLDETSGAVANDFTVNANDGAITGSPTWLPAGGLLGGAIDFTDNGYITVPGAGIDIANKDFSLSFWVKQDAITANNYIIGHSNAGGNNSLHIGFRDADTFTLAFWGNDMNVDNAMFNNTTDWMHFVCTYDAGTNEQIVYANVVGGGSVTQNRTATAHFQGTDDFFIGSRGDGNDQFNGLIDEVGVWDRTLTPAEAAELYNGGTPLYFFSNASEILIWDGDIGDWADLLAHAGTSHWDTGGIPFAAADSGTDARITAGHATVATAGQEALIVNVTGGNLSIVGGELTVQEEIVSTTEVTVGSGGVLTATEGAISGITIGTAALTSSGTIAASDADETIDGGALTILDNSTLIKAGDGTLQFTSIGAISATGSAVRLDAGTLRLQSAGAISETNPTITVAGNATLEADTTSTASFGALTINDGITLTVAGADGGTDFASLTAIAPSESALIAPNAGDTVTIGSALSLGDGATFTSSGAGTTVFTGAPVLGATATIGSLGTLDLGGALSIGATQTVNITGSAAGIVKTSELQAPGATVAINFADGATLSTPVFNDAAAAKQINLTGNGALFLDSSAGAAITAGASTFKVDSGATLKAHSDLTAAPAGPLGTGGSTINLNGGTADFRHGTAVRAPRTYDFESGDLTGWTVVPYSATGTGDLFEGGKQPYSGEAGAQGTYTISTFRNEVGGQGDNLTGIIESDSFVIGEAGTISFQQAAGSHPLTGDPDSPNANMAGIALEREVGPGNWEMIETSTNTGSNWNWQFPSWDTTAYVGDTVRLRIYDTHAGGWGHTAVDDIQISSADAVTYGALNMGSTDFIVTQSSNLKARTTLTATFGDLTLTDGTLNITGVAGGTTFASLTPVAPAANVGVTAQTTVNFGNALTLGDGATITLNGAAYNFTGAPTISGTSATIATDNVVNLGGALSIVGKTLGVSGGGAINATDLLASGATTINLAGGSTLNVTGFNDAATAGSTVALSGDGELAIDGSAGGTIAAGDTTFNIGAGATLSAAHAAAGPMGVSGTNLLLNGGTFETRGESTGVFTFNQLDYGWYNDVAHDNMRKIDDGIANSANGGLFTLTPTPDAGRPVQVQGMEIWTGAVTHVSMSDSYVEMWSGNFHAQTTGDYTFYVHGDDNEILWMDLDQNGEFNWVDGNSNGILDSGEGDVVTANDIPETWNLPRTFTVALEAGEIYPFAVAHSEGGGGDDFWFNVNGAPVNPTDAAQNGWWSTGDVIYGAVDMTNTPIEVTADSNLRTTTGTTPEFGALTLTNGTLNVQTLGTPATNFASLAPIADSATVGIASTSTVNIGSALTLGDGSYFAGSAPQINFTGGASLTGGSATIETGGEINVGGPLAIVGKTLGVVGPGSLNTSDLQIGGPSSINFTGGATVNTTALNDGGTVGTIFDVTGAGTLAIDGSAGGAIVANNTTIAIGHDATVTAAYAAGGNLGAGGTTLLMDSGTFRTTGDLIDLASDALVHYGYHINNDALALDLHNNGGLMGGGDPTLGPNFHGQALLTDGPGGRGLDFDNDGDFTATGAIGQNDNYSNMWWGYLAPDETGTWGLRNAGDDDVGAIWIDLDQDGVFESTIPGRGSNRGEQVSYEDGGNKTFLLTAGEQYMVAFLHREGGGGSRADFRFTTPSVAERIIKPADAGQAGLWRDDDLSVAAISMPNTDVIVTADSDFIATTDATATFGELQLTSGILNVSGATGGVTFNSINPAMVPNGVTTGIVSDDPLTLTGVLNLGDGVDLTLGAAPSGGITLTDDAADGIDITIRTQGTVNLPNYTDATDTVRLTHAGPGTLQLLGLGVGDADQTTYTATSGVLEFSGATPLGGSAAPLNLAGGTVRITGVGAVAPAGAIASWNFNETSGLTAADSSGNGHNGTLTNGVIVNQAARPGATGTSFYFDGGDDFVSIPAGIDIANKSFTLSAWVKREAPAANDYIMGQGPGNNNLKLHFGFRDADNATLAFYADDSDHENDPQYSDTAGWHLLTASYNVVDNVRHIYWDGVDQTPLTNNPAGGPFQGLGEFLLGQANGNFFQGWIDDMYIYDSALSGADVSQLFAATGVIDAISLPGTGLIVTENSTLDAVTSLTATFGALSFDDAGAGAMLTTSGADGGIIFASTTVATTPTGEIGFDTASNTQAGVLDFNSTGATIVKTGGADLVLDPNDPLNLIGGEAFDVRAGRLIAQAGSNPLGVDTTVRINGGEVVLISDAPTNDVTFDNPIISTGGALTVGANGGANVGPLIATIGNGTTNNLTLTSGDLLIQTTDDYTLNIAGDVLGGESGGSMTLGADSTVTAAKTIDADSVTLQENASLSVVGTVTVNNLITETGSVYSGASDLTVRDTLTLNASLDLSGSTLVVDGANVTVNDGMLTVGDGNNLGTVTPVANVDVSNAGGLTLGTSTLRTERLATTGGTFDMGGTGSFIATGDVAIDPASGPALLELGGGSLRISGAGESFNYTSFTGNINDDFTTGVSQGGFTPTFADGALRLTDNGGSENTIAYRTAKESVVDGFDTTFSFDFHDPTGGGADGMNFLVSANPSGGTFGEAGSATDALNISLASYNNNLIRIKDGGTVLADFDPGFNLSGAGEHTVRVVYDGTAHLLDFYFDDLENAAISGLALDLGAMANGNAMDGSGEAYVGFSARTGGSTEFHDVTSWSMLSGSGSGAMSLPDTHLLMTSETAIDVAADVSLGDLVVDFPSPVVLTFTGDAENRLNLASTTFNTALSGAPGLKIDTTPKVNLGPIDMANSNNPVTEKIGTGEWIITDAVSNFTGIGTVNVNEGTLTLGDTGLLGIAIVNINNGAALKLSSVDTNPNPSYNEAIILTDGSTLLAGMADANSAPAAVVTMPSVINMSGQSLTLGTTDAGYELNIANPVTAGSLNLGGVGTVTLAAGGTVENATVDSSATGTINVPTPLTVTDTLTLKDIPITDNVAMQVVGANLATPNGTIMVSGTGFTMGVAAAVAPGGAVANWTFDETSGTTAVDSTGGNDGTIGGSIVLGQPARAGENGTSFYFPDGENLVTAGGIALDNRSFTLAAWAKRENPNADYFFGQGAAGGNNALHAGFRNNQEATFAFYGDDSDHNNAQYNNTDWHHLVFTYDATNNDRHIYWDGADQPVDDNPAAGDFTGTGTFRIGGRWDGNDNFQGWLDDLYVYDSALSQADVTQLYNASEAIIPTGPIDMPELGLDLVMGGPSVTVTINGPSAVLGDLTMGAITDLTIAGTPTVSFNNVTVNPGASTINGGGPEIVTIIRGTLATTGGADLTSAVTVNGDLTIGAGATLNAVGADIVAKSFTNAGGTAALDDASSLTLAASTLTQTDGLTTFAPAATVTGVNAIEVTGGLLTTPDVIQTDTLNVTTGGGLNAAAPVSVKVSATLGDHVVAAIDTPATPFGVSGSDVAANHTLTLNGGVMTLAGETQLVTIPGSAVPIPGMVGMWTFDDSNGNDTSGNGYNGVPVGAVAYSAATPLGSGMSLDLTGGDGAMTIADTDNAFDGGQSMSIAYWAKGTVGNWSPFISKNGESDGWQSRRHGGDATMDWTLRGGPGGDWNVPGSAPAFNGNWHFIVMTYDGAKKKAYMYGADLGTPMYAEANSTGDISASENMMVFGARDTNTNPALDVYMNGQLDDVYFFNRAIDQSEVELLYSGQTEVEDMAPTTLLPNTTVHAAVSSEVMIGGVAMQLGGLSTANGATLTVNSPAETIAIGRLTMAGDSMVRSTQAANTGDVAVIADAVNLSGGMNYLGDATQLGGDGDSNATTLTLSDGAIIDWTFDGVGANQFDGGMGFLEVKGPITLDGTLTVNVMDGIGTAATAKDLYVMVARGTITGDVGDVTIDKPAGWDWDSFAIEQRSPSTWALVLKNAIFGIVTQDPGDTDGNRIVDDVDLANFQLAFGLDGAELAALAFDADFDNDGDADLDDFVTLRQFFGTDFDPEAPAMPDLSQTPEPATMSLLALGALAILRRRRRKA
jgi:hypothetical protein